MSRSVGICAVNRARFRHFSDPCANGGQIFGRWSPILSIVPCQQHIESLSTDRQQKPKGLFGKFIDNIKEGFARDKDMQENIKKFQEQAEKLEESSAFKTAKKQFGVLGTAKEKTTEGLSKLSSVLKDGGEQLSESASKVVKEMKMSETFKKGQRVSEEVRNNESKFW